MGLMILIVFAILVFLGALSKEHHYRYDFTSNKRYSVSPQTKKILSGLEKDVKAYAFFQDQDPSKAAAKDLLTLYRENSKDHFSFEFVDPDRFPIQAQKYEVKEYGAVVLECGERFEKVSLAEEERLTNALVKLTRDRKRIIYVLEGHGEHGLENKENDGYSDVKKALENENFEVKTLTLFREEGVPEDADVVLVAGPKKGFQDSELEALGAYLKKNGKLLIMVDPEEAPGIEEFLDKYGILLGNNYIVDPASRLLGGDYLIPPLMKFENHPITRDFMNSTYLIFFKLAGAVIPSTNPPEGIGVEVIARTGPGSWAETDLEHLKQGKANFDEQDDIKGPVPVAAVVTIGDKNAKNQAKMVVIGDSDFVTNGMIDPTKTANRDFFLNTVNWLAQQQDLISIRVKPAASKPIILQPNEGKLIFIFLVLAPPLIILGDRHRSLPPQEGTEMSWRTIALLAAVLVAVGVVYFWDQNRQEEKLDELKLEKTVFPMEILQVNEIDVQRPTGKLSLRKDKDGDWVLKEPMEAATDKNEVEAFIDALVSAKKDRIIDEKPESQGAYGLDKPDATIIMKALPGDEKGEKTVERTLYIGKKNPTEAFHYARIEGEKPVFLISDSVMQKAEIMPFKLRDKTIWTYRTEDVKSVRLESKDDGVTLNRLSDERYDWEVDDPGPYLGDGDSIEALLFRLTRIRAGGFKDSGDKPLSEFGLDPPDRLIRLTLKKPEKTISLKIGSLIPNTASGKGVYAQLDDSKELILLNPELMGEIITKADFWREKKLVEFNRDDVEQFEIRVGDKVLACKKLDVNEWEIEKPKKYRADFARINDLLWTVKDARVEHFLDREPEGVPWDKPTAVVRLLFKEGKEPMEIVLAGKTEDGKGLYAKAPVQKYPVEVDSSLVKSLDAPVNELRQRELFVFKAPDVYRIVLQWKDFQRDLVRDGKAWIARKPHEERLEASVVGGLLMSLRNAPFEDDLERLPEKADTEHPAFKVELWNEKGEPLGDLNIALDPEDKTIAYAWSKASFPGGYTVKTNLFDALKKDLSRIWPDRTFEIDG